MKIYKPSIYRYLINFIMGLFMGFFVLMISSLFLKEKLALILSIIIFIIYLVTIIFGNIYIFIVDHKKLTIIKGKKEKIYDFSDVNKYEVSYKIVNGSKYLLIYEGSNESPKERISCDMLSSKDFYSLLNDLGVIGKNQKIEKIKIKGVNDK